MDPLKIFIFVAAFALLFLIGRLLSSAAKRAEGPSQLPPLPGNGFPAAATYAQESAGARRPPLIGAEMEFPISIPPVEQRPDGTYNRPEITNYYFLKTDLVDGPADHDCLFDELLIEARDPGNEFPLSYRYTVATLSGLRQAMQQNNLASLYLDPFPVVIVERWDLKLILRTVIDEIIAGYSGEEHEPRGEEAEAKPSDH